MDTNNTTKLKLIKENLKKITWTKPKDLLSNLLIVLIFSTFMTSMIYGIDLLVVYVENLIMSLF